VAAAEAIALYVETFGAWDDGKHARLHFLLERLSPRELDAYYTGIDAWRRSRAKVTET
jgi:hypothetical protein